MAMVVTHSGAFHSDEIMAMILLERFFFRRPLRLFAVDPDSDSFRAAAKRLLDGEPVQASPVFLSDGTQDCRTPVWIVRTRDPRLLDRAKADPDIFVLDVGGALDPGQRNLDHHQASMTQAWPDGTPLSSTGLAWQWLEQRGHLTELDSQVRQALERELIIPLDAHDNGVAAFPAATLCEAYNRHDPDPGAFEKARAFLTDLFENRLYALEAEAKARAALAQAWAARTPGSRFVVLEERIPYSDCSGLLKEVSGGEALLIGLPGKEGRYNLVSLPGDTKFSNVCPLPEAWRGGMDLDLQLPNGGPFKMAFVHKTGFMGVCQGDAALVRKVAQWVVDQHLQAQAKPTTRVPKIA